MRKRAFASGTILDGRAPGVRRPTLMEEESPVARGEVFRSHERLWAGVNPELRAFLPQHWMNLGDLIGEPRYTPHRERLIGCCGPSGHGGPNRICGCGAHIGTELSDCCMPHLFLPDPAATQWQETKDAP